MTHIQQRLVLLLPAVQTFRLCGKKLSFVAMLIYLQLHFHQQIYCIWYGSHSLFSYYIYKLIVVWESWDMMLIW